MSVPKFLQHRTSEKTTIESDSSSTGDIVLLSQPQQKERNIEIEKYFFLKEIIDEV